VPRVLDRDAVAWREPGGKDSLDGVQRAAGDREVRRVYAVGRELDGGQAL